MLKGRLSILLFLLLSSFSSSNENILLFSITETGSTRLGVVNFCDRNLTLEIIDTRNQILFSHNIQPNNHFFRQFDLTRMTEGEYEVRLNGCGKVLTKRFVVADKTAKLIKPIKDTPPVFQRNPETLGFSYLNPQNVAISIVFELNDEVVFQDRNLTGMPLQKLYSTKQMPKGDYTIKLFAGSEIYTYPLKIK